MIYTYAVTQQGDYHVKHNTVCQDAHCVKILGDHFAVAAVADGLGSEMHSDIAAKIAAETSVDYCAKNICANDGDVEILSVIKAAFRIALSKIDETARENSHSMDQYDTTLALAVYLNGKVFFGNSGDSGIVVLNQDGTYEPITTQQRDENGCVYPLFFGEEYWDFGIKEAVASVFLATDGMYETLFPYLLKGEDVPIYVALARYLMSEECLNFTAAADGEVQQRMDAFIAGIPGDQVSDDKTVLVMLDPSIKTQLQPESYYQSPDWVALKKKRDEEYRRMAYPHLFSEDGTEKN